MTPTSEYDAGSMVLAATELLRTRGETSSKALSLAAYYIICNVYGRDFARTELGLTERTERLWWARIRDLVTAHDE